MLTDEKLIKIISDYKPILNYGHFEAYLIPTFALNMNLSEEFERFAIVVYNRNVTILDADHDKIFYKLLHTRRYVSNFDKITNIHRIILKMLSELAAGGFNINIRDEILEDYFNE